ncbi:MAG TPA: entericidin A/B family lipoprotein [Methylococcaceae bacterium]|nr:entericidin A/B family lipoprotein [Methylococcaceae bacterium]
MNVKRTFFLVLVTAWLCGCNTLAGVGRDIEKTGEAIQKSTR